MTGIFSTLLLPETMGKTLEELSNEDQKDFVKGQLSEMWHVSILADTAPFSFRRYHNQAPSPDYRRLIVFPLHCSRCRTLFLAPVYMPLCNECYIVTFVCHYMQGRSLRTWASEKMFWKV